MRTFALVALLLATACGKPLLYAEVEIPSAIVTMPQQTFPATANPAPGDFCVADPAFPVPAGSSCLQKTIQYDLGSDFRDLIKKAETLDLRLLQMGIALATTDPLQDFTSVVKVRVMAEEISPALPAVELAYYVRDPAAPPSRTITVATHSTVNLGPYVQAGFIKLRSEMVFDADIPAFTADVTGDFYMKVLVDWGKQAGL